MTELKLLGGIAMLIALRQPRKTKCC